MWLDFVTYLHHLGHEDKLPWYRGKEWSCLRGGLTTIDRDYGWINNIHHDIGTHVVHHLFPQIPHYHLKEATEAAKPVLGKYYREQKKSWMLPLHLLQELVRSLKKDHFVSDTGEVLYYQTDVKLKAIYRKIKKGIEYRRHDLKMSSRIGGGNSKYAHGMEHCGPHFHLVIQMLPLINRSKEFVFASHNFDIWESWTYEGSLDECKLVNCRNPSSADARETSSDIMELIKVTVKVEMSVLILVILCNNSPSGDTAANE